MSTQAAPYEPPAIDKISFNCPHCRAFSHVAWGRAHALMIANNGTPKTTPIGLSGNLNVGDCWISVCARCREITVWIKERMVYPDLMGGVVPNDDMPNDIKTDFEEARAILGRSPRGAAALLRLCVEKVCKHLLKEQSKDINADIARLVKDGLPQGVQRALDTVRVVGNECVHAGQLDFRDNADTANKLFGLVNFIVEDRITRPREIDALYATLPATKLTAIENRDGVKPPG